ncbi:MAG: translation initiation factor IF-2 subunit gamma [Nanoarchaeota archaeon]|nr:translation initiation factor IF-2 subunit gamma [Nanoarchaeota archaeon]
MVEDIIIGVVGNFSDGKTTLIKALTSESTLRHSEEKKRGITIRLGYAHLYLYRCEKCNAYSRYEKCEVCGGNANLEKRISIIDSPGHKNLMTVMLSGASLIDAAILVVSAASKCPQPQTEEHLEALKIIGVNKLVVAQTKVDLVGEQRARESYNEIKDFLSKNGFENVPIIPVLASANINITEFVQEIGKLEASKDQGENMKMLVVRSFDANVPGTNISDLKGGILGGALSSGRLSVGDKIMVYPGVQVKGDMKPLSTTVAEIQSEFGKEQNVGRGITIGVRTLIDPALARNDGLSGSLVVKEGVKPILANKLNIKYFPLKEKEVTLFKKPIQKNEMVLLNILAGKALGTVVEVRGGDVKIVLNNTVLPFFSGDKGVVSRRVEGVWYLAGSCTVYE